ncbi:MAG: hypothetical protein WC175_03005 [Candidatus Dojkabacteria bacterium]
MAKKNVDEYERVLTIIVSGNYLDNDGYITLTQISDIFRMISDRTRDSTIVPHIKAMVRMNLLKKRGELSYQVNEDWKDIIKLFKVV